MRRALRALAACVTIVAAAGSAASCTPEEGPGPPAAERVAGARIYKVSCAGCHGNDARGNGPIAPYLTVKVPDLTLISARRGGAFPQLEVFRIIDGQAELAGHGPRHMPVWGYEFFGDQPDDEAAHRQASDKVDRLVVYLQSVQRAQ